MIDSIKKRLIHRTKILRGQMAGLERMIEREDYCVDIISQSLAIQKSLASLNRLLLENHLRTHLTHQLHSRDSQEVERAVSEMLRLYELNNVRGRGGQ
jgi:DNA-binding FrmR family transcriptional regulator